METFLLIGMPLLTSVTGFYSRSWAFSLWVFVLMTHGMFVHFFGDGLRHMPMYVGVVLFVSLLLSGNRYRIPIKEILLLFTFFVTIFASFILNAGGDGSLAKVLVYGKPLVVCILVTGFVKGTKDLSIIANGIILAAIAGSFFNIYQQAFGVQLSYNEWDSSLSRAAGLRGDPNDTAMLLIAALPLVYYKLQKQASKSTQYLLFFTAFLIIVGIILTGSRSGFLVASFVGALILLHRPKGNTQKRIHLPTAKNILALLVVIVSAAIFAPNYYWERVGTIFSGEEVGAAESLYSRAYLLKRGYEIWVQNPILGVGPGRFNEELYGNDINFSNGGKKAVAHNMYIEFAAEFGSIGIALFLLISAIALVRLAKLNRQLCVFSDVGHVGYAYMLSLLSLLLFGVTLSQGYNPILWFIIAIGLSVIHWARAETHHRYSRRA